MPRLLAGLPVLTALLSVALAAPVPKEKPPEYFPTKVGAKWVYKDRYGELIEEVTAVEDKGDAKIVTVARSRAGGKPHYRQIAVSGGGLFHVAAGGAVRLRPICLFRPGDSWRSTWDPSWVATVHGPQTVEVPAGKFRAVRLDSVSGVGPGRMEGTTWYAPGVGLVKDVSGTGDVLQLISFTPGKD